MKGIVLDIEGGDLALTREGLAIGDVAGQEAALIVTAWRGELKEAPLVGGEARALQGGSVDVLWPGRVRRMLRECGVECSRVEVGSGGEIEIE